MALTEKLTAVADAIRGKTGRSEALTLEQMATEIAGMETGGSRFDILHTVEITEPVQVVQFDWNSAWNEYVHFYVVPDNLVMSTTEWLCFRIWNGDNQVNGNQYIGTNGSFGANVFTREVHTSQVCVFHNGYAYTFGLNSRFLKLGSVNHFKSISFSPYYGQNTMNSGKIHIYGGK